MKHNLIDFQDFLKEQLKDPEFKTEWERIEPQYRLEREIIKARVEKRFSQKEVAKRANTTQAVISRIESMSVSPSINMVDRIARAFGKKLQIRFVSPE